MNFLFVHNNFPAQFQHIATHLARNPSHKVMAIGANSARQVPGVSLHRYSTSATGVESTHPFARSFDLQCRRAEQVLYTATALRSGGFVPDVIVVHSGWGENLPLRAVFPKARIIVYCEFYYRATGQDVNFDPEFGSPSVDSMTGLAARNANGLIALVDADHGLSPTQWQRSTYPKILQDKIKVIHEGVDTGIVAPDPEAVLRLPSGRTFRKGDPVVTFVSRNLEPLRGYHVFMRALPRILQQHPDAQILILGGNGVSYGARPPSSTWKDIFLREVEPRLDLARVHFLDTLPYHSYLKLLQISCVHVYFTYPFVLSWSLIEAMSAGCTLVASDTAPVQDVLDDKSAILIPFLDAFGLADAVIRVLRAPSRLGALGERARATVLKEYDLHQRALPDLEGFLVG